MGWLVLTFDVNDEAEVAMEDGRVSRVKLIEIRNKSARIGFDFPREIRVDRTTVADSIRRYGNRDRFSDAEWERFGAETAAVVATESETIRAYQEAVDRNG